MDAPALLRMPALAAAALFVVTACGDADAAPSGAPEKLTVAGDSISVGLGSSLREAAGAELEVKVIGEGGTGLARPDRFDWPQRLEELARDLPPEVLVFSLGSNDAQDLTASDGAVVATMADSEDWEAEYRARLERSFDAFEGTGTRVVWVGHVRTEDAAVADNNRRVHMLAAEVAQGREWVQVEDLAELTGGAGDEVSGCLIDDGLHLSVDCYGTASAALLAKLGA